MVEVGVVSCPRVMSENGSFEWVYLTGILADKPCCFVHLPRNQEVLLGRRLARQTCGGRGTFSGVTVNVQGVGGSTAWTVAQLQNYVKLRAPCIRLTLTSEGHRTAESATL